ncbi:hypothetical protein CAL29_04785 [Bordetella genomosp. 10]|uniref:Hydrolase n=1 Tax=Bordetella genomosp. 10 TaxID=1416804 RepID=A0A261SJX5_9BORD|nr:Cof-type HAD-IIB family hydrolase [Bordetella genomosp. 10]OZI37706.1 hypothetical protein CAL29_04785 [Bordetella genomosp. 10]
MAQPEVDDGAPGKANAAGEDGGATARVRVRAGVAADKPVNASGIALLVSDVDGTLLRMDKSLAPATIAAVDRLRAAGVRFTLVSARPPRGMLPLIQALNITVPTAAFNGGAIVGARGEILESTRLTGRDARIALDLLLREPVETWVFADDQWLLRDPAGEYVPLERKTLGYDGVVVDDFSPWADRIDKIVAASSDPALLGRLEQALNARIAPHALALRSQTYYLDITHARANKGDALSALARQVGVPLTATAAIGDGDNDVPMFKRAGLSIAMGHADPAVRAQARCVTASNDKDGLAQAIDRIILGGAAPGRG